MRKRNLPNHFIEVKPGQYLSKDDPNFLEKYLKFYPHDGEKLLQYAEELETKKKYDLAMRYYQRAVDKGYLHAIQRIRDIENIKRNRMNAKKDKEQGKHAGKILFLGLVNFCILTMFLLGGLLFLQDYVQNESAVSSPTHEGKQNPINQNITNEDCQCTNQKKTVMREMAVPPLEIIAVENALKRYKEQLGYYPNELSELEGKWLSVIPNDIAYIKYKDSYRIYSDNNVYFPQEGEMELVLFPDVNELGLYYDESLLVKYPVASGKAELPFHKSAVSDRVVNPNGGKGPLGTRGLVLQDNYAIHGTNDPTSIGKHITEGCIRMNNSEIEELFPYVALGTPFHVKAGNPSSQSPLFATGLPQWEEANKAPVTAVQQITYNWKS